MISCGRMKFHKALQCIAEGRRCGSAEVDFVYPIVSTMLAAECASSNRPQFKIAGDPSRYAKNIGLIEALSGQPPPIQSGGLVGKNYSPLTRLALHEEVEASTDTVARCLHEHLDQVNPDIVNETNRVIGELHDNVASHARGAGFSALQFYKPDRIEFAVVDNGIGLLRNAKKADSSIDSHAKAIHWALQKGNTSAGAVDDFAQILPSDALQNPYPSTVKTLTDRNHHMGEGLWHLVQLVGHLKGDMWLMTGDTEVLLSPRNPSGAYKKRSLEWRGVAIEVNLPVRRVMTQKLAADDETFAEKYGL